MNPPPLKISEHRIHEKDDYLEISLDGGEAKLLPIWEKGDVCPSFIVDDLRRVTRDLINSEKDYREMCKITDSFRDDRLRDGDPLREWNPLNYDLASHEEKEAGEKWIEKSRSFCGMLASIGNAGMKFSLSLDIVKRLDKLAKTSRGLSLDILN
jgi:hypothetical protein